jgi:hypothetical protein
VRVSWQAMNAAVFLTGPRPLDALLWLCAGWAAQGWWARRAGAEGGRVIFGGFADG